MSDRPPNVVGIVVHHDRPEAASLAKETATRLLADGHEVRVPDDDAAVAGLDDLAVDRASFATDGSLTAVVSLGGDGTILRTVHLLGGASVPIIGVNLGTLGYLAEIEPQQVPTALDRVLAGDYEYDDRMLLEVTVEQPTDDPGQPVRTTRELALNEAVLERKSSGHTVRLDVEFSGQPFTPYETDALIISTPTGSTAYAFSARGPIIEPAHRAVLLTPVSPHMLFDRSLVLDPATPVRVTVAGHRPALLTVDGRLIDELPPGSSVSTIGANTDARLVRLQPRHFHSILKAKFGLRDR